MASASRYARPHGGPQLSAKELAEHAQKQADLDALYRREQQAAEATFRASVEAALPRDPWTDILARLGALEDQMRAMRDIAERNI